IRVSFDPSCIMNSYKDILQEKQLLTSALHSTKMWYTIPLSVAGISASSPEIFLSKDRNVLDPRQLVMMMICEALRPQSRT
ncbi:hypothetical protein V3C99_009109, partial [Haemonchus contortus]